MIGCSVDPKVWVVEWSPDQGCIHIDTIQRVLEVNRAICLGAEHTAPSRSGHERRKLLAR